MMLEYKYKLKIFIEIRNFGAIMKKYRRRYGYKRILTALIAADLLAMSVCGSVLASEFDARTDVQAKNWISPVKNQLNYGSCWTFGMLATVEANWNKQRQAAIEAGKITEAVAKADFSERYLAWLGYNAPLGTDASTYPHPFYPSFIDPDRGVYDAYDQGGLEFKAAALLTRGTGLTWETNAPFASKPFQKNDPATRMQGVTLQPEVGLVTQVYGLYQYVDSMPVNYGYDGNIDNERQAYIKQLITENGIISVGIYAGSEWNDASITEIYNQDPELLEKHIANHEVGLVGWDDDYEFTNYKDKNGQPLKGAWIMRNSWGEKWGDGGYAYVSYHDTSLTGGVTSVVEADPLRYTSISQHGQLGSDIYWRWDDEDPVARETGKGMASHYVATRPQFLKAVGFCTLTDAASYEIEVLSGATDPENGKSVYTQSGTFGKDGSKDYVGYRTVELDKFTLLPAGGDYVVRVKIYDNNGKLLGTQIVIDDLSPASPGNSFISFGEAGGWQDITADGNFSIVLAALGKDTILANGGDFTVGWLDDGGVGGSIINLGKKDELYGSDPFDPERKTLSNMTVDLEAGVTDSVYGGSIIGEGNVIKIGTGKLDLTGYNTYSGDTLVKAGTLAVNGYLTNSNVTVGTAAADNAKNSAADQPKLQGNGFIAKHVENINGIVAPGNSIGHLTVGSYTQGKDGVLELEGGINGGDKLTVRGTAKLDGTVQIVPNGYFANGKNTLKLTDFVEAGTLEKNEGLQLEGKFSTNSIVQIKYEGTSGGDVTFSASRADDAYSKIAATVDGHQLAAFLDQKAGAMTGDAQNIVGGIDFAKFTIDATAEQMTPRAYDSLQYAAQSRIKMLTDLTSDRLLENERPQEGEWSVYAQPLRLEFDQNSWRSYAGFSGQSSGILVGAQRQAGNWRYGLYGAYLDNKTDVMAAAPLHSESQGGFIGITGHYAADPERGQFYYGLLQGGAERYDTKRNVMLGNSYFSSYDKKWTSRSLTTEAGTGWRLPQRQGTLIPVAALRYSLLHYPGITESSAEDGAAVSRGASDLQSLQSKVGLRIELGKERLGAVTERSYDMSAMWYHEWLSNDTDYSWNRFAGQDRLNEKGGGSAGRDTYTLSAGMQLQENNKFTLRAAVGKAFGKGYHDSKVSVDCQWYF
ncbi:MAG: lectin like domain-containing protein [Phascolarctobacterium sp.]|uniref:C1 family peptidase n=1 Tax=Phascolarctobacterium sp. TaxID=2049039 RepID=UPI0025D8DCFD|nr:C1 family peptidase [Phascolarctobacterium sp.]MCC8159508.1 lectin like domain-containing protein [Phascolarctobacterium sp.]